MSSGWIVGGVVVAALAYFGLRDDIQKQERYTDKVAAKIDLKADMLSKQVASSIKRLHKLELAEKDGSAYMAVSEFKRFSPILTPIGTVVLSVRGIKPLANGSQVRLAIGNPLATDIVNGHFSIAYGETDSAEMPTGIVHRASQKLSQSIEAGHWSVVTLVLQGVPPAKLGYIQVSGFSTDTVSLYGSI